jgi:glycosyltransferase involved in cell wall biosynthesis
VKKLSVIIPCYNEEKVIAETHSRITGVFSQAPYGIELVFIDDGSRDGTFAALKEIAGADTHAVIIRLSRNFGHQAAVAAGLRYCTGTEAAVIDADLQDPPEEIPKMLALMDSRMLQRRLRPQNATSRRRALEEADRTRVLQAAQFRVRREVPPDTGDFRLMDRKVIDVFNSMPEAAMGAVWKRHDSSGGPFDGNRLG